MIAALADAGAVLGRNDYLDAARGAAEFVWTKMRDAEGGSFAPATTARAKLNAYFEDHAYLVEALLTLYESTFELRWFEAARETADSMIARFADPESGGFFTTSDDHEALIARRKDLDDHPIPPAAPRPPTGSCGWRRSPASAPTPGTQNPFSASSGGSPPSTHRRSLIYSGRSTSISRR